MSSVTIQGASPWRLILSLCALVVCSYMATSMPINYTVLMMYSLGFTHYILAIHYSKRGLQKAWSSGIAKWPLLLLLPLSFVPLFVDGTAIPGLVLYFGFHHAMSEVYFDSKQHSRRLRNAHYIAVTGSYFAITGHHLKFLPWLDELGWVSMLVATPIFFIVNQKHDQHDLRSLISTCPWIVLGPLVAILGEFVILDWRFLINWHFLFWLSLPYLRKGMFTLKQKKTYWIQNVLLSAIIFTLFSVGTFYPSVLGDIGSLVLIHWLGQLFLFWSYFHISWSFLISGGNPQWLKKIFQVG